ncbi:MAG: DUF480 domain-containing protein [Acidimicrobiales bacterium]
MDGEPDDAAAGVAPGAPLPVLDEVEQRVVGSLLEKEVTVPQTYPLTLNALRTACNQSSSREPVMDLDEATITDSIDRLKARGLARIVHASSGARAVKYRQVLDELLHLEPDERALLTVLLLRGPQAPGELKARTDRLHPFADRGEVERVLEGMAQRRGGALVRELERQPGHHDARWIHLLGTVAVPGRPGGASGTAIDRGDHETHAAADSSRESVLDEGADARDGKVRAAYDALASSYAEALGDALDAKPFDRWLLDRVAALAEGGPVADAGCGPGHVAFHLALAGADALGFDVSSQMVAEARARFGPELAFEVADLRSLPAPPSAPAWSAIVAWYSLVHLAGSELAGAVEALASSLAPGGWLALAVHVGEEVRDPGELFGVRVDLTFVLHDQAQVLAAVAGAGLEELEWYRRSALPASGEADTERLYVLARRPVVGAVGS